MRMHHLLSVSIVSVLFSISACSHMNGEDGTSSSRRADAGQTTNSSTPPISTRSGGDRTPSSATDCADTTASTTRDPRCPPNNPAPTEPPEDTTTAPLPR